MNILYETKARMSGGDGDVICIGDADLKLTITPPRALGGSGDGVNPEQLLASGYASCFMRALRTVAKRRKIMLPGNSSVAATVGIGLRDDNLGFGLRVALAVDLPGLEEDLADALVTEADDVCPLSHLARQHHPVHLSRA
jgi:osmotically inducible protein OsmC